MLALLAAVGPAAGTARADDPAITEAPQVTGVAQVGQTLVATTGAWTGTEPITATYSWQRCTTGCKKIAGATGLTYTPVAEDVGFTLRIVLTVTNALGDEKAASDRTGPVAPAPTPPAVTEAPQIAGVAQVGQMLVATAGAWTGTEPVTATYAWQRCSATCEPIAGATDLTYTAVAEDVGFSLRIVLTATNAGGAAEAPSAPTDLVAPAPTPLPEEPPVTTLGSSFNLVAATPVVAPPAVAAPVPAGAAPVPAALKLLDPFPVVRIRGYVLATGARVTLLTVRAPRGSRITVRCVGIACNGAPSRWAHTAKLVRARRFERFFQAGVRLTVTVTAPKRIGKHTTIVIRGGRPPWRRDRCLYPGSTRPRACPVA